MKRFIFAPVAIMIGLLISATSASAALTDNLVHYWTMDEEVAIREDAIGSSDWNGVNIGFGAGKIGNAMVFLGGGAESLVVTAPTTPILDGRASFTIAFWTYFDGNILSESLIGEFGSNLGEGGLQITSNGTNVVVYVYDGDFNDSTATVALPSTPAWIYIIGGWDLALQKPFLSLNNSAIAYGVDGGSPVAAWQVAADSAYLNNNPTTAQQFDEMGVWDRVLTADERTELYNSGTGVSYSSGIFSAPTPSPTPTPASGGSSCHGGLTVGVSVSGGSAVPSDVRLALDSYGMSRDFPYIIGCASHAISASALSGYTRTWTGDCDASGIVSVDSGSSKSCTAMYTYNTPASSPTPTPTPTAAPTPSVSVTPAPIAPTYFFTKFLARGSRGTEVKALQDKLRSLGFFPVDIDSTGFFGPTTERAVKAFQAANNIPQLGIVGPLTRAALNR